MQLLCIRLAMPKPSRMTALQFMYTKLQLCKKNHNVSFCSMNPIRQLQFRDDLAENLEDLDLM